MEDKLADFVFQNALCTCTPANGEKIQSMNYALLPCPVLLFCLVLAGANVPLSPWLPYNCQP
jgi:hypothetical protein